MTLAHASIPCLYGFVLIICQCTAGWKMIPPVLFPVLVAVNGPFHLSATAATLKQSF
jgi:hypothetical protein